MFMFFFFILSLLHAISKLIPGDSILITEIGNQFTFKVAPFNPCFRFEISDQYYDQFTISTKTKDFWLSKLHNEISQQPLTFVPSTVTFYDNFKKITS